MREGKGEHGHGHLRAYGAGILSSPGELSHSIRSTEPQRLPLTNSQELLACMASKYKIDTYQSQYFVIEDFQALMTLTSPDFTPHYRTLASR